MYFLKTVNKYKGKSSIKNPSKMIHIKLFGVLSEIVKMNGKSLNNRTTEILFNFKILLERYFLLVERIKNSLSQKQKQHNPFTSRAHDNVKNKTSIELINTHFVVYYAVKVTMITKDRIVVRFIAVLFT